MTTFTRLSIFLCLFFIAAGANAANLGGNLTFAARLDGSQEVPAVTTTANAVAGFTLNQIRDSLWLNVNITGLSGVVTGIYIHEAAAGTAGPVVIDLATFLTGTSVNAILSGATITKTFISKLLQGLYYINVHTAANPGGEIRGQILLESDIAFTANLNGAQETPAVSTTARGLGVFNLAQHNGVLKFNVVVDGLSGAITGIHFHTGAMGVAGAVVQNLATFQSGNTISGEVDPTAFLASLKAGTLYINVHTAANPGGEIRGQVLLTNGVNFDAMINGAQETPAITTNAKAVATFKLNNTMDSLFYDVQANGLSGTINSAHFHNGAFGVAGSVALDLTSSIAGNRISGFVTGSTLTNAFITNMVKGNIYINLHTTANPGGEIRGQLYRVAREGYNMILSGLQETPPVVTTARGGGIVSIDRDETNVHYLVAASNIVITGAHFHAGAKGESGPVVYALTTAFINNGAAGYWKSTDATPFTSIHAREFAKDSIYINLHTATNPNGETRSQASRQYNTQSSGSGINSGANGFSPVILYPNPAVNEIYVNSATSLKIMDAFGKTVSDHLSSGKIDISNLQSGLYFIIIEEQGAVYTKSFVKQ